MSEGEGFLARWSRRKRAAAVAAPPAPPAAPPEEAAAPPADAPQPPAAFDPASLPPVESLTAESDFAAFLREEVPAALRRAALRRAWALDPAICDFVGPADYAWDFNAPDGMAGFALDLPGDVGRLVAQAVGLEREPEGGTPGEETPPAALAELAAPPPGHERLGAPAEETPSEPGPETLPAPAAPVAELAPPARRRHGGALPS